MRVVHWFYYSCSLFSIANKDAFSMKTEDVTCEKCKERIKKEDTQEEHLELR